jgi:hypothetical protein
MDIKRRQTKTGIFNEQLEHEKHTGSLKGFFPRAVFIAEIIALSEPIGGTRRFREKHSKGNGPLKALLQEQSEWAKRQITSRG